MKNKAIKLETLNEKINESLKNRTKVKNKLKLDNEKYTELLNGDLCLSLDEYEILAKVLGTSVDELVDLKKMDFVDDTTVKNIKLKNTNVVGIVNTKGGIGKTALTVLIATRMADRGYKVLLLDLDPQISSSQRILNDMRTTDCSDNARDKLYMHEFLDPDGPNAGKMEEHIIKSSVPNLDFVASDTRLASFDERFTAHDDKMFLIKKAMSGIIDKKLYDFIFIDMPADEKLTLKNIIHTARFMLMPVACNSMDSLDGVNKMMSHMERFIGKPGVALKGYHIVLNMVSNRKASRAIQERAYKKYSELIIGEIPLETAIPNAESRHILPHRESKAAWGATYSLCNKIVELVNEYDAEDDEI